MISLDVLPSSPRTRTSQLAVLTAVSIALLGLITAWSFADPRLIGETPVWTKPLKFAVSFVVLFGTLGLVEQRLSPQWRDGRTLRITVAVMAAAMITEMSYMIFMAAQAQGSHFNFSTPFTAMMYQIMGVGAVSLMVGVAIFGAVALRDKGADMGPALRWGVGWGFILSFVLTVVTAGFMSSVGTHVGVEPAVAATLPLTGWSASVGDVRPAHFLALHAMQFLPLAGLYFDRKGFAVRHMRWAALAYFALTVAVFAQALAGLPLIRI